MPAVFGAEKQRVRVDTNGNPDDDAVFVFPGLDDPRMIKALDSYMKRTVRRAAMGGRRGNRDDDAIQSQQDDFVWFFDEVCEDLENSVAPDADGNLVALNNKSESWKSRISKHFKVTAAGWIIQRPAYGGQTEAEAVGN